MTWQTVPIESCARIVGGATPSTSVSTYWDGDICWATPKDLSDLEGHYIGGTPRKITASGLASCASEILPVGSVLFSSRAPIGHVAVNSVPIATNQGFKSFVPVPEKLDAKFLYHWLRANRGYLQSLGNGATFKEVSKAVVARLEIPLPPLGEQRRIAAILDAADSLRAKRRAALTKLDQLAQSIFIEMFGDPAEGSGRHELLGEHLEFVTSGGRGWAQFYTSVGDRFIRSLDVRMNYLGNQETVFVTPPDNAEARRTKVEGGDVLLTITGSRIGRVAPVPLDFGPAYISQHVAILRVDQRAIVPTFLSFFLSLPAGGQRQISRAQYGQTKPGLNFEQIRNFRVPVPPIKDQLEFARRVAASKELRAKSHASLIGIDDLFTSLQHRAFRGEL